MTTLSKQAQAVINAFGTQPGVTAAELANLSAVVNGSPTLVNQINAAVAAGHLKEIAVLPAGSHAGGTYDGQNKRMNLPLDMLTTPAGGTLNPAEPTFVLGHELQHGFNHATTTQAYTTFNAEVQQIAKSGGAVHDYTPAVEKLINSARGNEASAEIAGWNATVDMVKQTQANPTLKDIYLANDFRMKDFIDENRNTTPYTYTLKPNLTLEPDLSLKPTAANVAAMGTNYFDQAPIDARLGHHGNSDYANRYGAYAASVISQAETQHAKPHNGQLPQLTLNMSQLGLDEKLMEENGIDLGAGAATPRAYYDSSTTPPTLHHFDHSKTTHTHTPIIDGDTPTQPGTGNAAEQPVDKPVDAPPGAPAGAGSATDDAHATLSPTAQRLLTDAHREVQRIADQHNLPWDQGMNNTVVALARLARAEGMTEINLFAVKDGEIRIGQRDGPFLKDTAISAKQAANTPATDSLAQLAAADQHAQVNGNNNSKAVAQAEPALEAARRA